MSYCIIDLDRRKKMEALKRLRGKKLKTQQEMASLLKVARQTYNTYENNLSVLSLEQIQDILVALEATDKEIKEFFYEIQQDILSNK